MRFSAMAAATITALCLLSGCGPDGPTSTAAGGSASTECTDRASGPTTYQYAARAGTDPDLTSLDVYLPPGCGPAPVVLWVHGGGWRTGDRSRGEVARKAALVNGLGAALVSVNYRLSSPDNDVRWPDHGNDVAAAVAWTVERGPAHGLDASRLVLMGHSAGAQLVASVAAHPTLLTDAGLDRSTVDCTVVLDVQLDLTTRRGPGGMVEVAFSSDPEVLADASPTLQVRRHGAPPGAFLVVTRGRAWRTSGATDFVDAVNAAGGQAELVDAGTYSHNQLSQLLGAPGEQVVTPTTARFVSECLTA